MKFFEVNFDGLVGPTHNYSGLSLGNVASAKHKNVVSYPKKAALQGLAKMKALLDLGFHQAVLPPQERPHILSLKNLGYKGTSFEILQQVATSNPILLNQLSSASCMWTANAATIAPSCDSQDGKVHLTPANLHNKLHRSIEHPQTERVLKKIFADPKHFVVHSALPSHDVFGDEGAANHTRLCESFGDKGLHLFVYGKSAFDTTKPVPQNFPARQTLEACEALIRLHQLPTCQTLCLQQNPDMIDAGVFHNDVISVGTLNTFFYYDLAFVDTGSAIQTLQDRYFALTKNNLETISVPSKDISVQDVVSSYLFNTQLLQQGQNKILIAPTECENNPTIKQYLDALVSNDATSISQVLYFDLRESMQNGGGPACLRQRIVLSDVELKAAHAGVFLTPELYITLTKWVEKYYWDEIRPNDLADPKLLLTANAALDELSQILNLGTIYDFQT